MIWKKKVVNLSSFFGRRRDERRRGRGERGGRGSVISLPSAAACVAYISYVTRKMGRSSWTRHYRIISHHTCMEKKTNRPARRPALRCTHANSSYHMTWQSPNESIPGGRESFFLSFFVCWKVWFPPCEVNMYHVSWTTVSPGWSFFAKNIHQGGGGVHVFQYFRSHHDTMMMTAFYRCGRYPHGTPIAGPMFKAWISTPPFVKKKECQFSKQTRFEQQLSRRSKSFRLSPFYHRHFSFCWCAVEKGTELWRLPPGGCGILRDIVRVIRIGTLLSNGARMYVYLEGWYQVHFLTELSCKGVAFTCHLKDVPPHGEHRPIVGPIRR